MGGMCLGSAASERVRERSLRRRRRAALGIALLFMAVAYWARPVAAAHPQGVATAPPPQSNASAGRAAEEPAEAMRTLVDRQVQQLRMQLDQAEGAEDYSQLLERKTTVEAALLPMQLLRDAALLARAEDGRAPDMLRALRVEYRNAPVRSGWRSPSDESRVQRAIAAWAPGSGEAGSVALRLRTASEAWVGPDAPPLLQWTVQAQWTPDGPALHARCWWHEPATEHRAIDFPLSPEGFDCWWNPDGVRILDDRAATHAEAWSADPPLFSNPPELFALIDGMRALRAGDARVESALGLATVVEGSAALSTPAGASTEAPPSAPTEPTEASVVLREVRTEAGRLLRRERWQFAQGSLRSLVIDQEPVRLVHHSIRGFDLLSEVEGEVVAREPHRPVRELIQHAKGMRVAITFRHPDPARDQLPAWCFSDPSASVPDRIVLLDGTSRRAWVEIESVTRGAADAEPGAAALVTSTAARRAIVDRIDRAIARVDLTALQESLDALSQVQAKENIPLRWRVIAIERVVVRLWEAGERAPAQAVAAARWFPSLAALGEGETAAAARRLRTLGMGEVAAVLESAPPASAAEGGCDPQRLTSGASMLLAAIRNAVESSHAVARGVASATMLALCSELSDASEAVSALDEARAGALGQDARAVLDAARAGMHPLAVHEDGVELAAARFARAVALAAEVTPLTDVDRAALRRAVDPFAIGAARAIQTLLEHGQWGATEVDAISQDARLQVQALRPLVGNPFLPDFCQPPTREPPSAGEVQRMLVEQEALGAMVERVQRRAAVIGRIVGSELGGARMQSAQAQVAQEVAHAAVQAYSQWQSGRWRAMGPEVDPAKRSHAETEGPNGPPKRPPSGVPPHLSSNSTDRSM